MRDFFSRAPAFLPHLGKKPHVLVLDHPMDLVKMYHKKVSETSQLPRRCIEEGCIQALVSCVQALGSEG